MSKAVMLKSLGDGGIDGFYDEVVEVVCETKIINIRGLVDVIEASFPDPAGCMIVVDRVPNEFHVWSNDLFKYMRTYTESGIISSNGTILFYLASTKTDIRKGTATPGYEETDGVSVYVGETLILRKHKLV